MPYILIILILLFTGCGSNKNKSVTGDYYSGGPGELVKVSVSSDSIRVTNKFRNNQGNLSYSLVGNYGESGNQVEAISIMGFDLSSTPFDSLVSGYLTLNVEELWNDGNIDFKIYRGVATSWDDSTKMTEKPDYLAKYISEYSYEDSSQTKLVFEMDSTAVRDFLDDTSFVIKNESSGNNFMSFLSDDSSSPPLLNLVVRHNGGELDTLEYSCNLGTYFINAGVDTSLAVVSDGDLTGFVLHVGIPDSIPVLSNINKAVLNLNASNLNIADDSMTIEIYRITAEYTTFSSVSIDTDDYVTISVTDGVNPNPVDLTSIIQTWHSGDAENYGVLVKYSSSGISPNRLVLTPADSLAFSISYTKIPEDK